MTSEKNIRLLYLTGCVFTVISGSLMHFLYDISGKNRFVGYFCPVSESVWEHLKMIFFPYILFLIAGFIYFTVKKSSRQHLYKYLCAAVVSGCAGSLAGMLMMVSVFYTVNGVFGKSGLICDILNFIFSVFASCYLAFRIFRPDLKAARLMPAALLSAVILIAFSYMFVSFSFEPPDLPIFISP